MVIVKEIVASLNGKPPQGSIWLIKKSFISKISVLLTLTLLKSSVSMGRTVEWIMCYFFPFQNRNHKVLNVFNFFLSIKTDSAVWGRSFKVQRISLKKLIKFPNSRYWNIVYSIQVLLKARGWNWARYAWSCIEEYYVHLSCVKLY